ncbi:MAG: IS200/IS605 family element transposase accessory protein TnpB [Anaerolineae bacterium]|nr:IS200/IS605 family element transposase accessory protein TnpB [Anaerolineae bacterium]
MKDSTVVIRTYKYRLYPSKSQETNLFRVRDACHGLYNMVLAERKYVWQEYGETVPSETLQAFGKRYRKTFPYAQQVYSQTVQSVIERVDEAYQGFFRRVKKGEKPGYPRFKSKQQFNSFEFKQYGSGCKIDGRRLKIYGVGRVKVRWHRELIGKIKLVRIKHQAGEWYASFVCEVPRKQTITSDWEIGIDVGVSALITTSDGEKVENPKYYRAGQAKLRRLSRKLARAQRGSRHRKQALQAVQRQHRHVANQREDFLHKLTHTITNIYGRVAIEDLQINNMVKNRHLSKSILDSGWGLFKEQLQYKAAEAGVQLALVNPYKTSRKCSNCQREFVNLTLQDRWVECLCGLSLDRDHNAAINILKQAGWDTSAVANVECV